uniref:uncharacterized protein LOC122784777 n=1 Tax=Solea senegalensis TaxID=28829 RepID=UPI001CD8CD87|nr:uncharacterized protein LOC122784777 [Solea senegalensis]
MKIPGQVTSFCLALLLAMTSVSAVQRLNSISDLKKIDFGRSVPRHSLLLLYWFASVVEIDRNYVIRLNFDPNSEDYGSHHYGNFENLLERLPPGHQYYTVGNLNQGTTGRSQLPHYVANPGAENNGGNRDRIIISVNQQNSGWHTWQIIHRVYITQHYGGSPSGEYDRQNTYEISSNLLRQIRQFSEGTNLRELTNRFGSNINDSQLWDIRNTWGQTLAGLGLLLYIVIGGGSVYFTNQQNSTLQSARYTQPYVYDSIPENNSFSECCTMVLGLIFVFVVFLFFMAAISAPK